MVKVNKIVGLVLLLIFLLVLTGVIFKISRLLVKSVWDGQSQLNLALNPSLAGQPVLIAAFNPEEKSVNILLIPAGTFIETIHSFGPCRAESIYRLGELNKKGGELLSGSLQEYLGIPVEVYASKLKVKSEKLKVKSGLVEMFGDLLKGEGETNLTRWDLVRLWLTLRSIRQDKVSLIDLGQTSASQEVDLLDGTKANKIDTERLESIMSQFFVDKKLKQEDLTVAVLNGTNHAGLANKVATLIKNIGGQVMTIGDTENGQGESLQQCQIKSEKKYKNSYTVRKLSHVFDCQWEGEPMAEQRANLVLIVGKSYWEKLVLP